MLNSYTIGHKDMMQFLGLGSGDFDRDFSITGVLSGNLFRDADIEDCNEDGIEIVEAGLIKNYPICDFYPTRGDEGYTVSLSHRVEVPFYDDDVESVADNIHEFVATSDGGESEEFTLTTDFANDTLNDLEGSDVHLNSDDHSDEEIEELQRHFVENHWPTADPNWTLKITVSV